MLVTTGPVIILPLNDRSVFGRREFAGYLKLRIPHALDDRVLAVLKNPRMRAAMGPDDVGILSVFGHRKAVEAVRSSSSEVLIDGFLAVAVAIDINGDTREIFRALAPLFHSARLLSVGNEEILAAVASRGASSASLDEIRRFSQRPERDKSLSAMGLREEGTGNDFRYV